MNLMSQNNLSAFYDERFLLKKKRINTSEYDIELLFKLKLKYKLTIPPLKEVLSIAKVRKTFCMLNISEPLEFLHNSNQTNIGYKIGNNLMFFIKFKAFELDLIF